ncbi:MAG: HesA/MoeB/ThiF family protein [Pseudomonadota bacterium]
MSRDARHLALKQVGESGQRSIADGHALLIGVGGIGCPAASYLAACGVGEITLSDFDTVDETNLGRQILFGPDDVGELKADVARRRLLQINPDITVNAVTDRLDAEALRRAVDTADVVLDGCDNFATRFAVSDACVATGTRLVSGSAIRMEGQLAVFGPDYSTSPTYRCFYSDADESLESCAGNGVLSPVPGVIGTLMAVEAIKYLVGIPTPVGRLSLYQGATGEFTEIQIRKRTDCDRAE